RYRGARAGYLTVVSVDAAKKVSVYYPPGPNAERVEAGHDVPLRSAIELDETLGRETVIGVRCDEARSVAEVVAAAQRGAALGPGCDEVRLELEKTARTPR